jgi:ATP-dependent helicase HrpA
VVRASDQIAELRRLLPDCLLPDQVRLGSQLALGLQAIRAGRTRTLPVERWLSRARNSVDLRQRRSRLVARVSYPAALPITSRREEIVAAIRGHPVVVIAGETGSGKTTQIPKMCLEAGLGVRARIGCTQPRRVAALSISRRIAGELDGEWGREVGCKIRFTDRTRPESSIKVMTDGILLAELQGDPLLSEYDAIILDEAHERSLNIDFLLGCLKLLLQKRSDLKLVITSATIDTRLFSEAFDHAPVIEVSGRMYPVEVRYRPLDTHAEEEGELTSIEAATAAVDDIVRESPDGDVLVFMPGERDIRETCDLIEKHHRDRLEVVPLFGRLSAGEQQRVFDPGPRRRVVVATNVAETSLTVPRIRYVVDSGLARINRYSAGTRSRRLPIEPISQSSANQRKGRCGRLSGGICIRLFNEEDFAARRPFTEPEIQRCNLADVILRMKAFHLGEVETFPFVEPPSPTAIRAAYALLQELGALDEGRELTLLGRELARLPLDPSLGRMILEAREEHCLTEVLVIAAGLSIQDPRERPFEQREAASAAHRRFEHPQSDFLTLLNIWNAYHDTWESLKTQSQLRKFCRSHFLAFLRMREWVDLHGQIEEALHELDGFEPDRKPANYAAIHRALLTGLLGHVAQRVDRNTYRTAGERQAHVFPGSALHLKPQARREGRQRAAKPEAPATRRPSQPAWIVAGELVETSRPFARTLAGIEPEWVIELAPHLVRTRFLNPRLDVRGGRVVATERVSLRGLKLRERTVGYRQVDPAEATRIFIRTALVEEALLGANPGQTEPSSLEDLPGSALSTALRDDRSGRRRPRESDDRSTSRPAPLPPLPAAVNSFLEHNRQTRAKIEFWQTRLPSRVVSDLDEALFEFYTSRLADVSSVVELKGWLKEHGGSAALSANPSDLLGEHAGAFEGDAFPDRIALGHDQASVRYAYAPWEAHDGLTVRLTAPLAEVVDPALLDWSVPALREARVLALLHALPKSLRKPLMPLAETARAVVAGVRADGPDYPVAMGALLHRRFGVFIPAEAWRVDELPDHLRPRIEIVGRQNETLAEGRDLPRLREELRTRVSQSDDAAWQRAALAWVRFDVREWSFGDLPEKILVAEVAGFPLLAYPGLTVETGAVHLRLFRKPTDARQASPYGVAALVEKVLERDLAWLRKDLRGLRKSCDLYVTLGPGEELVTTAWENIRRHHFTRIELWPLRADGFERIVESRRAELRTLLPRLEGWLQTILRRRQEALLCRRPLAGMQAEVDALVPGQFLRHVPFERLPHLGRYLQALLVRAERAALNPQHDARKAERLQPFLTALHRHRNAAGVRAETWQAWNRLRWLLEEFKVSVFAQELGTSEPASEKRLTAAVKDLERAAQGGHAA